MATYFSRSWPRRCCVSHYINLHVGCGGLDRLALVVFRNSSGAGNLFVCRTTDALKVWESTNRFSSLAQRRSREASLIVNLRFRSALLLVACCALAGCHMGRRSVTREGLVGSYTYVSEDPESRPTDHNLSHLILRPNGTYELVEGGTTKAVTERYGLWRIKRGSPPDVLLDHVVYPIEIKRNEVRLLVNLYEGTWWAKAK